MVERIITIEILQLVRKWINNCKFGDISSEDMKQANELWKRYDR